VSSGLPVLLLVGERDPISPPSYARKAAATLGKAHVLELPRQGRQLLHLPCGASAAARFLDDPSVAPAPVACQPVEVQ
jgi:pimeloyl-ACP methyl ester carboxylesterase